MKTLSKFSAMAVGIALLAGCTTNPYTGEREAGKAGVYGGIAPSPARSSVQPPRARKTAPRARSSGRRSVAPQRVATVITSTPRKPSCGRRCRAPASGAAQR